MNGPLDEEVYVLQPVGFEKEDQESKVYELHKALYGLKQVPRSWNKKIDDFLREKEILKCTTYQGVYLRIRKGSLIILCSL